MTFADRSKCICAIIALLIFVVVAVSSILADTKDSQLAPLFALVAATALCVNTMPARLSWLIDLRVMDIALKHLSVCAGVFSAYHWLSSSGIGSPYVPLTSLGIFLLTSVLIVDLIQQTVKSADQCTGAQVQNGED